MPCILTAPAPAGSAAKVRAKLASASGSSANALSHAPVTDYVPLDATLVHADGSFSGYASLFNVADMGNDIIAPGAFAASLQQRGARGIKLLYQHRAFEPIGVWTTLREDARGLYAQGQLTTANTRARDILALLKSGAIDGLSIGFRASKSTRASKSAPRILTEVDLWEISIVTFPMMPGARVTSVKTAPRAHPPPLTTPARRLAALTSAIRSNT